MASLTPTTVSPEPRRRSPADLGAGAPRDVVQHHRAAGRRDDLLEVVEDAGLAGLVVVGRDEQQRVDAELLGLLARARSSGPWRWCRRRRRPLARSPTASLTARRISRSSRTVVVGLSPVVPLTTTPSWPCSTRWWAMAAVPSRSTAPSSVNAVAIAVSIRPKGAEDVMGSGYSGRCSAGVLGRTMTSDSGPRFRLWPPVAVGTPLALGLLASWVFGDPLSTGGVTTAARVAAGHRVRGVERLGAADHGPPPDGTAAR